MKVKKKQQKADSKDVNGTNPSKLSNHMEILCQKSYEKCEFCDEVCINKYNLLVHNAKHIIIPLIKTNIHKCNECLHHFTTIEALQWHSLNKHPNITQEHVPELLESFLKKKPTIIVKTPAAINASIMKKESLLQSFAKKEPSVVIRKENGIEKGNDVIYEISDDSMSESEADTINNAITAKNHVDRDTTVTKDYFENEEINVVNSNKTIKERLRFEEDLASPNRLMNDLTTLCAVNLKAFDNNWMTSIKKAEPSKDNPRCPGLGAVWRKNAMIIGNIPPREWTSVHYDDLKNSGDHKCFSCSEIFPSRYDAIVHETTHMRVKPWLPYLCRLCDWYLPRNRTAFKEHLNEKHGGKEHPKTTLSTCGMCKLKYFSLKRHLQNYHPDLHSNLDSQEVETIEDDEQRKNNFYDETKWNESTVKVCDLCYSFCREKLDLKYEYYGDWNEVGVRYSCDKCHKKCFSLKIVRRRHKVRNRETRPPNAEAGPGPAPHCHKRHPFTNKERLKNVHQRLKKMKLLNKF